MDQSPWEAYSHSAGQIPHLFWQPKVHYCVHKSTPPVPILTQVNPAHTFPPYFLKIHYNIILPSMPRSSMWSLLFKFLTKILHAFVIPAWYMSCPSHTLWLDCPNRILYVHLTIDIIVTLSNSNHLSISLL